MNRGPRTRRRSEPDRAALKEARDNRKAERRAEDAARRKAEAEEQARRRLAWERPRPAVEPELPEGPHRAGQVAIVGRPNVGKSTLLNALLGQKLAATTHKPQTTRKNLLGVLNPPGAQLLLLDTPGHHQAKGPLNRSMVAEAEQALAAADVLCFVLEARPDDRITPGNQRLLELILRTDKPVVVALNKVDRVKPKEALLLHIASLSAAVGPRLVAVVPISAREKVGLEALVQQIASALPEQDNLLPPDELTDQAERDVVAELIREKLMLELDDELPYAVAVTIAQFEDLRPKLVRVSAFIHVERESQKGIVIGKQGARLKSVGARARKDIEFLVGAQVYLELEVRVTEDWSQDRRRMAELGYGQRSGPHSIDRTGIDLGELDGIDPDELAGIDPEDLDPEAT